MADDVEMTPVTDAEPPKANPISSAAVTARTVQLKPVIRKPAVAPVAATTPASVAPVTAAPVTAAPVTAAPNPVASHEAAAPVTAASKPAASPVSAPRVGGALRPGLKLPPKPAGGLKSGLNLPPKPALGGALKPGLKLPARPVIRKPGSAPLGAVKPPEPAAAPTASKPAAAAPAATPKPAAAPAATTPMAALKSVTQKLKGMTQPIAPQQAVLHKTGIIADVAPTDAQKQAAKSKTSRISLSEAMGAAPVSNDATPAKTIRIKRADPAAQKAAVPAAPAATPAGAPAVSDEAMKGNPSLTQVKTLKISRPSTVAASSSSALPKTAPKMAGRPKFTIKKPGAATTAKPDAAVPDKTDDVPEIADIPDMPVNVPATGGKKEEGEHDVPKALAIIDLILQLAACAVMGYLGWLFYQNWMTPLVYGGCQ